jgi:hypothetical protein
MKTKTHLISHLGMTSIHAFCGTAMQPYEDKSKTKWTNKVNYWGKTGIIKHNKIDILTFNPKFCDCEECLKEYKKL